MTGCDYSAEELGAFIDGEMDALSASRMETHIATCPACAAQLARTRTMRDLLKLPDAAYSVPAGLAADIARLAPRPRRSSAATGPARRQGWRALWDDWGPGLATAASVIAIAVWLVPVSGDDALPRDLLADHVRSLMADHLTDVTTSDRHTVKPWFAGKTSFSPPVIDLAAAGFPLVGGRLDYAAGHPVAALVYRRRLHVINLFIWAPTPHETPLAAGSRSIDGMNLVSWSSGGLVFCAVSDLNAQEIGELRDHLLNVPPS